MPEYSALDSLLRPAGAGVAGCWTGATPEVRRRLLGLVVAALAPAALPGTVIAQHTAGGTVRLVIRAEALPYLEGRADSRAIEWMAPESMRATEELAGSWAAGDEAGALRAWRAVLRREVEARRLLTEVQALAAADWIAARASDAGTSPPAHLQVPVGDRHAHRADDIRQAARTAARAAIEGRSE